MGDYKFYPILEKLKRIQNHPSKCMLSIFGRCNNLAVNSHSISATCLKLISPSNTFITPKVHFDKNHDRIIEFKKTGIKKASAYSGFCAKHDNLLFKHIDSHSYRINSKTAKLLYFRSLCYEANTKKIAIKLINSETLKTTMNDKTYVERQLISHQRSLEFLLNQVQELGNHVLNNTSPIDYFCFTISQRMPFAFAGCYSFALEEMQTHPQTRATNYDKIKSPFFGCIPSLEGTNFICAWPKGHGRQLKSFLKKLRLTKQSLPEYAFQFGIEKTENIYFDTDWYDELTALQKETISKRFDLNLNRNSRDNLRPFKNLFDLSQTKQTLKTNSFMVKRQFGLR